MRFLIIADLHGRMPKIKFKDFDAIIAPGDFCSDKELRVYYDAWMEKVKKNPGMKITSLWKEVIKRKGGMRRYNRMVKKSLMVGRDILEHLNSFGKPVFIVPGNWDESYGKSKVRDEEKDDYSYVKTFLDRCLGKRTNPVLTRGLRNVNDCQFKLYRFEEFNILGYGLDSGPLSPQLLKSTGARDFTANQMSILKREYHSILKGLDKEYAKRNKRNPTIFLSHNVPYNTKLDLVLKKSSWAYKKHYGSTVARDFIVRNKPLICIGGHMHEHFGKDRLGKTTIINAGFGPNVNTLLDIENGKIKKLKFIR